MHVIALVGFLEIPPTTQYINLLYEAMQDESAELCFIFRRARSVLYFPLEI